jgi:hypothetical protein
MDFERVKFCQKGLSESVIEALLAARRPSTNIVYAKLWRKFCSWKAEKGDPEFSLPDTIVLAGGLPQRFKTQHSQGTCNCH